MRIKPQILDIPEEGCVPAPSRIRRDLEGRGLTPGLSQTVARRLGTHTQTLGSDAYQATLDAVTLAFRSAHGDPAPRPQPLSELQHLMKGFAGELHKLEEALRILDAYLTRMRAEAGHPQPLH